MANLRSAVGAGRRSPQKSEDPVTAGTARALLAGHISQSDCEAVLAGSQGYGARLDALQRGFERCGYAIYPLGEESLLLTERLGLYRTLPTMEAAERLLRSLRSASYAKEACDE